MEFLVEGGVSRREDAGLEEGLEEASGDAVGGDGVGSAGDVMTDGVDAFGLGGGFGSGEEGAGCTDVGGVLVCGGERAGGLKLAR